MEQTNFNLLFSSDYAPEPDELEDFEEDGIRFCGKCRMPLQKRIQIPHIGQRLVSCDCACEAAAARDRQLRQKQVEFEIRMDRLRTDRISDLSYERCSFDRDDHLDDASGQICRRYVDSWEQMRTSNMGMLLYGTVGSGKTFRASCIANAMWDKQVPATVTSFPRLLNLLQDSKDRQGLLDQLNKYELLVIDDLGTERDSAYALEQVYNIVDSRAKSGKPLIVTTNLTLQELKTPQSMAYARIYDRILELCPITLKMTGDSRRTALAKEKRELARKILGVT